MTNLPTARTHLAAGWLIELVWCKACHHQAPADLQAIIDAGQGDRPLKDLKFRCTKCGSSLTTKPLGEHRGAEGQKLQITPIQAQVAVVGCLLAARPMLPSGRQSRYDYGRNGVVARY